MNLDQMEDIVCQLEERFAFMEAKQQEELRKAQQSSEDDGDDDECEVCGSTDHTTDEHPGQQDEEETSSQRVAQLNAGGGKSKTSKDDDTSGGDKEARRHMAKKKLERIVSKTASQNYDVERCLSAVAKSNYSLVSKADFAAALDRLTEVYMRERGKTNFAKCYSKILDTPEGSKLYKGYVESQGADVPQDAYDDDIRKLANRPPASCDDGLPYQCLAAVSKGQRVSKRDLESALDALAMAQVSKSGQTFYQAYSKVLDTPAGAALMQKLDDVIRYGG